MKAVFLRELKAHFTTATGYIYIAAMMLAVGIYSYMLNFVQRYPNFSLDMYYVNFVYLVLIPVITMRSFAGERRTSTGDLLFSLPLRPSGIVLGKYFATVTVILIPCLLMGIYPAVLARYGAIETKTVISSIFGFFLLGCALAAIGMFISSLTSSQFAAIIISFAVMFLAYHALTIAAYLPAGAYASFIWLLITALLAAVCAYFVTKSALFSAALAVTLELALTALFLINSASFAGLFPRVVQSFALFSRFERFVSGLFDLGAAVYYISVSALFLFLCTLSLERRRWS